MKEMFIPVQMTIAYQPLDLFISMSYLISLHNFK